MSFDPDPPARDVTRRDFLKAGAALGATGALAAAGLTDAAAQTSRPAAAGQGGAGAIAAISLPKGGGAIRSIGETFQPNLFTGTGNFSVPIVTSLGRSGFGPQLTLQYSTGHGNGPFGLGWQLSIPRV